MWGGTAHRPGARCSSNTCMGETAAAGVVLTGIPLRGLLGVLWTGMLCPAPPAKGWERLYVSELKIAILPDLLVFGD